MDRVVGILGGMGPQATVELMRQIVRSTPAEVEHDHVRILVDSNPHVPGRTAALTGAGPSPGPELARMARGLVGAGADVLAMPCNTAHAFADEIEAAVDVPLLHMIDLAVEAAAASAPGIDRIGLLATRGTRRTRLYHDRFEAMGFATIEPDEDGQSVLDELIVKVKTHDPSALDRDALQRLLVDLVERGADVVVAGCTEVPLLLPDTPAARVVDPSQVLAEAVVRFCKEVGDER